ncbi:MAG: helix-turn-helix transcriptional regulator [Spirochaetaceae bacterium]|nr:helix-turn-helix transcriptional regulator [Spirochaetaceae bacterium]
MILKGYDIDILRANAGLTIRALAATSKCSPATIQKARQGKDLSVMAAGRISKALGVPLEDLIEKQPQ